MSDGKINFFPSGGCDELKVAGWLKCFISFGVKGTSKSKMINGSTDRQCHWDRTDSLLSSYEFKSS